MSEADLPRRMRVVAVGAAVVAMLFTLVAVIVVLARDGDDAKQPAGATVSDHVVKATDVVRLRSEVEVVVEAGAAKGVRVKDAELAKTLGLVEGDVITALSGKPTTTDRDVMDVMLKTSMMHVTTLYADVTRANRSVLLRWKLDGDLRQARSSSTTSSLAALGSAYTTPPATPGIDLDPIYATIEKVDDTHYKLPRGSVDTLLANPLDFMKGARVVPSMRNGQADGFKLYAIRPSSPFAKLGFQNGDTIHGINGFALDTPDQALEVYTKLRDATEVTFDLTRRGKPVSLRIQITK
jgi:type II secretory pathway component PulC